MLRTEDALRTGPVVNSAYPDWATFFSPPTRHPFWVLVWNKSVVCKRVTYHQPSMSWACQLRTACCYRGMGKSTAGAYCLECHKSQPYDCPGENFSPAGPTDTTASWFDPFTDPLRAHILAIEAWELAVIAEAHLDINHRLLIKD